MAALTDILNLSQNTLPTPSNVLTIPQAIAPAAASTLPDLTAYLTQPVAADVAGTAAGAGAAGLGSLGSLAGLAGPLGLGVAAATALPGLVNSIANMFSGLPASAKPNMYAQYLASLGGLPADLGAYIQAAQQQAGSGTGLLSMSGPGAFNPNFAAGIFEALTGQNLGTLTAPATGGVQNPVSLAFQPASKYEQALGLASGLGYTPAQLSSPQALAAIEQATQGGFVGTGQNLGPTKVVQDIPAVVQALASQGIYPQNPPTIPPGSPLGNLQQYLQQQPGGDTTTPPPPTTTTTQPQQPGSNQPGVTTIPIPGVPSVQVGSPTSTAISNPTQTVNVQTQLPSAYAQFGLSVPRPTFAGWAPAGRVAAIPGLQAGPVITPQLDMSAVTGATAPSGGGGGGGATSAPAQQQSANTAQQTQAILQQAAQNAQAQQLAQTLQNQAIAQALAAQTPTMPFTFSL